MIDIASHPSTADLFTAYLETTVETALNGMTSFPPRSNSSSFDSYDGSSSTSTPGRSGRGHHEESSSTMTPQQGLFHMDGPQSPIISKYFSRKHSLKLKYQDLPMEEGASGYFSPAGIFFIFIKLTAPLAYLYIAGYVIRDLGLKTDTLDYVTAVPLLGHIMMRIEHFPWIVHLWAIIEAIFYVGLKLHLRWLQYKCPLEMSLNAEPMKSTEERQLLFDRIMECEKEDPVTFVTGWFFDAPLETVSRYDILDFLSWCMFEGRNQEHLTEVEARQLNGFASDLEECLSVFLHGVEEEDEGEGEKVSERDASALPSEETNKRPTPRKHFKFRRDKNDDSQTFFTNLYENYQQMYDNYRHVLENDERVQDLRNFMSEKRQQIFEVEESAIATANTMYENAMHIRDERMNDIRKFLQWAEESARSMASEMSENAYFTLVEKGSNMDKRVSAFTRATAFQLTEAWHRVIGIKERLETATFVSKRRKQLHAQLKSYRLCLDRMQAMSTNVSSKQMADVMLKITKVNEALGEVESGARDAFLNATGYAKKLLPRRKEPLRYAKYSSDPIFDVDAFPLAFHLLVLSITEGGLRVLMKKRGFERRTVGTVAYYYHPGDGAVDDESQEVIPIVFCHGIGVGLIYYIALIDQLLEAGRPLILPEIPYVNVFRLWQTPNSVLKPHAVASTLTALLYECGFTRAVFAGHSYGSSWVSYMCKLAPHAVHASVFVDPICFLLHLPYLTKKFVYHRVDRGSTAQFVRTDAMINWTIQRGFPWARVALFTEEFPSSAAVFLSDDDELVPSERVQRYMRTKGVEPRNVLEVKDNRDHFGARLSVTSFHGVGHGDWIEHPVMVRSLVDAMVMVGGDSNFPPEDDKKDDEPSPQAGGPSDDVLDGKKDN